MLYHNIINAITLFIEVINTGSFVTANQKLGLSKPTVSHAISKLESRFKTKLIKRTTRK